MSELTHDGLENAQRFSGESLTDFSFDDELEDDDAYDDDLGYLAGGGLMSDQLGLWKAEEDYEGYTNHIGMAYLGDGVYA